MSPTVKASRKNAQHSAATAEHGTPREIVELARAVLGRIDVDPATSEDWNQLVGARRIFTRDHSGLEHAWFAGAPAPNRMLTDDRELPTELLGAILRGYINPFDHGIEVGTVFANSPGDPKGELVRRFWIALAEYYRRGFVTSAIWVGFSVEQLARLQRVGARSHPLQHTTLIPDSRIAYRNTPTTIGEQPSHASYVTLLSDNLEITELFAALGSAWGHVIRCGYPRR